ncbi:MAG: glycosyltransferase [Lachnospiraceae bacterium]|nr:glycosyltransferase [Lachnospiraceae bacterium]
MISIVFVSNFFNHHERFFCDELYNNPDVEFMFIQTQRMDDERVNLGWGLNLDEFPYVMCSYGTGNEYNKAIQICNEADVLILGSAPYEFVKYRVKHNKLTFYYAERLFRKGLWHMLNPCTFFTVFKRFIIPGHKSNFYLLASSAYTALDTYWISAFSDRRFKWGHFIEVLYPQKRKFKQKRDKVKLLWVGRFLPLKHPEYPIKTAKRLKELGVAFSMDIIGSGIEEENILKKINQYNLSDNVSLHSPMPPEEVRNYMEDADIYMFTSDFNEGWGAVLGEAMTSGCAVVSSHGIGATPFLVKHGINGLIYRTGNYKSFETNVIKLINDSSLRERLSENAIDTMMTQWNPCTGATRFCELCKSLLTTGKTVFYQEGPISKADILKNNWFSDDTI